MRKAPIVARAVPIASQTAGGREPAAQAGALRLPDVAGVYNAYAYADEKRTWLDRWAQPVAAIAKA